MHAERRAVPPDAVERGAMHADRVLAAVAARQHAMVHVAQLAAAGLGRGAIAHRVARGRLVRIHRGVYLVGAVVPPLGYEMAAVLAGGRDALLSHVAAVAVWGIHGEIGGAMHITVPGRDRGRIPGVVVHRAAALSAGDVRRKANIPLTAPARALLEAAATLSVRDLGRAYDEGVVRRLLNDRDLRDVLARHPRRRGAAALRDLLESAPALTRSQAEEMLLALVRAAGIPPTGVNVRMGRYEVDFVWRSERLVVEVDGFAYHSTRAAFERDRRRDAELSAAGYQVIRVTWRQLVQQPEAVIACIAQALVQRMPG